jgi:hypothetical protein
MLKLKIAKRYWVALGTGLSLGLLWCQSIAQNAVLDSGVSIFLPSMHEPLVRSLSAAAELPSLFVGVVLVADIIMKIAAALQQLGFCKHVKLQRRYFIAAIAGLLIGSISIVLSAKIAGATAVFEQLKYYMMQPSFHHSNIMFDPAKPLAALHARAVWLASILYFIDNGFRYLVRGFAIGITPVIGWDILNAALRGKVGTTWLILIYIFAWVTVVSALAWCPLTWMLDTLFL